MYKSRRNGSAGFPHFDNGRQSEISESRSPAPIDAKGGLRGVGTHAAGLRRRSPGRQPREKARPGIPAFRIPPRLAANVRHFPRLRAPTGHRPPKGGSTARARIWIAADPPPGAGASGDCHPRAVGMRVTRTLANVRFMPFAHAPAGRCCGLPTLDARLRRRMSGPRRSSAEGEGNRALFPRESLDGRARRRRARFGGGSRQRRASRGRVRPPMARRLSNAPRTTADASRSSPSARMPGRSSRAGRNGASCAAGGRGTPSRRNGGRPSRPRRA